MNEASLLESPLLGRAGFRHGFFTRNGGVSTGPYRSLSFSLAVGDEPGNVAENLRRAAGALGVPSERIYYLSQVHGRQTQLADGQEPPARFLEREGDAVLAIPGTLALACAVRSADCVPILVADRATGAVAAIHAGWRGVVAGVVGVHVLLRRLPFFVVAMSHATFPGVVIASVLGFSLFLGGSAFGLVVVVAVVALGASKVLDDATVIGVVLAGSFALGVLVLSSRPGSSRDLSAFLVGSVLTVSRADLVTTAVVGVVLLGVLALLHKELVLGAFDPQGAAAAGYRTALLDFGMLSIVTVALVTAVPAVGTLLAVALLTVPALAARLWADRVVPAMALAAVIGAASGVAGLCLSAVFGIAAGGAIALSASAAFVLSAVGSRLVRA